MFRHSVPAARGPFQRQPLASHRHDQLRPPSNKIMPVSSKTRRDVQHILTCTQAYHSALNEEPDIRQVGNLGIYPIKTRLRGPAPVAGI